MQSIFISKKVVTSIISNKKKDVTTSRKRTIKFDKIFLYHDKSIKKHRDYVQIFNDDFSFDFQRFFDEKFENCIRYAISNKKI
jgi:hypothetical protein